MNNFPFAINNPTNINYPDNDFSNLCWEIHMLLGNRIVPFISKFVDSLDDVISQQKSQKRLSAKQKYWIAFCLLPFGYPCYKVCMLGKI